MPERGDEEWGGEDRPSGALNRGRCGSRASVASARRARSEQRGPPCVRALASGASFGRRRADQRAIGARRCAPRAATARCSAFRCDRLGCIGRVKGKIVALIRHEGAVEEDCRIADIVIAPFTIGQRCRAARVIVDRRMLKARRACALYRGPLDQDRDGRSLARASALGPRSDRRRRRRRALSRNPSQTTAGPTKPTRARRQSRRVTEGPPSSGGSGRPDVPARARGRGRRCASRKRDWRLRARWSRLGGASA